MRFQLGYGSAAAEGSPELEQTRQDVGGLLVSVRGKPGFRQCVSSEAILTSDDVADAYRSQDASLRAAVGVSLTKEARERFYNFTSTHIGKTVAIVLDDEVVSAPVLRSAIGDAIIIEGGAAGFTEDEIRALIVALKGADRYPLPTTVQAAPAEAK